MNSKSVKRLAVAALLLAIGLVLPFFTAQLKQIGEMLLPMHIPILLCGILCGYRYGAVVGAILPILRSLLFSMPQFYPSAVGMMFELAAYGLVSGLLYPRLRGKKGGILVTLIFAMLIGRIVWGIARTLLAVAAGGAFTMELFLAGAFTEAIPGIILQLVLIPVLVLVLEKNKLMIED